MKFGFFSRATGLVLLLLLDSCYGMLPTAELDVILSDATTPSKYMSLASQASFGIAPPMRGTGATAELLQLSVPPAENANLCQPPSATFTPKDMAMLVPRGDCTFETKAYHAQQLGAKAVIVYGTLGSRYTLNTTAATTPTMEDVIWPVNLNDYDCQKGRAEVPSSSLSFDPLPYNGAQNDPALSEQTSQNLCLKLSPNALEQCPSKACLLTGNQTSSGHYEACCAWDLHVWMYIDPTYHMSNRTIDSASVKIPVVYVTMKQGQQLLRDLNSNAHVHVAIYERWRPRYSPSSTMIWILAVFVAALASHFSAHDYHAKRDSILRRNAERETGQASSRTSAPTSSRTAQPQQEETLELNAYHALGFLVMSSSSLLVLFYFKIYGIVKIMYALGCSKAFSTVLLTPVMKRVMEYSKLPNRTLWNIQWEDMGEITIVDLLAHILGYSLGLAWLILAFSFYHPEVITFFWVMQDIFGACMCILFLQVIKLNSIRVASILLVIAFFYDIFFVFVSPLIFSKSVMIDVATSGGPPPNPEWCEKYPDDPVNCQQRGNPLPMLFTIPRFADYQGGANLLGLGDVVVPGLLLSFAARFDAAKSLLGVMGGGNGSLSSYTCPERKYCGSTCWNGGYFCPTVIAYAIGLLMANAAVYIMAMGQPALLYLVPCCLGMVLFIGWRRNELSDLWDGPKAIRAADVIVYGVSGEDGSHAPIPQGDEEDAHDGDQIRALAVPSAAEDQGEEAQTQRLS